MESGNASKRRLCGAFWTACTRVLRCPTTARIDCPPRRSSWTAAAAATAPPALSVVRVSTAGRTNASVTPSLRRCGGGGYATERRRPAVAPPTCGRRRHAVSWRHGAARRGWLDVSSGTSAGIERRWRRGQIFAPAPAALLENLNSFGSQSSHWQEAFFAEAREASDESRLERRVRVE